MANKEAEDVERMKNEQELKPPGEVEMASWCGVVRSLYWPGPLYTF
jgi:hypothetical protein